MNTHSILFVCLGNICRSPTAEGVFRDMAAAQGLTVTTDSAGTGDWHIGTPPDRRATAEAARRGHDISDLRARQITPADFDRFDLILAMDRSNQRDIETLRPRGNTVPVRLFLHYAATPVTDVPDPYVVGGFDRTFDLIEAASRALLASLRSE
ncbi:low molecular weight phosphotyrosine protein phosphatase [Rhodobacteraceae bacterium 2376]|uniref:protein-tyrosine-phosphatase n=1 Tax=Rhabdonatronobacter sediminivivens TaxID=2743469 RepID=A0A7Z0I1N2_9RHOB|nr:low molecular weight protein-tyrosine-phosphatase [Rhabdonatronobacter sediminivivens]NYS25904.1 low molecular weight phosphotyrosine protein phosphatase [Rhabdonatronobacter sediminivivens]